LNLYSYPLSVPGYDSNPPTTEEVAAWAAREHKRREAWAAGPTQGEQEDWARQYRWRAAVGLSESRLGPSPDEITDWAERERRRRQTWLAGPTDEEKRGWRRRRERQRPDNFSDASAPMSAEDEVDAWAQRERQRRQAWLTGPTDDEKRRWARRETSNWGPSVSALEGDVREWTDRWMRDADLASKGTFRALSRLPFALWSYLVESGRTFEEDFYEPPLRRRVRF
jgi:hypothetical protein